MPKARVFRPQDLVNDADPVNLNEFFPALLAEGDSWFTLGGAPARNLLEQLDFSTHAAVVNLAFPGDTAGNVASALRRIDAWASEFGSFVADSAAYPFTAILLSGGGNDLIDAIPHLLKAGFDFNALDAAGVAGALDPAAVATFDDYMRRSFTGVVDFVRTHGGPNASLPIFCHTYDYPTPNDAPAMFAGVRVGQSWMRPRLLEKSVPERLWVPLADHLVRHLADVLGSLNLPDLHVVRTLDTCARAQSGVTGESGDWDNEIHPNKAGYKKLARKLSAAISAELGIQ